MNLQPLWNAFTLLWRGLDRARRLTLNLLFLGLLLLLLAWMLRDARPPVPGKAALVVAPSGLLVEQLSGDPVERALMGFLGQGRPETLLKTVVESIESARDDDRIQALYLDLDGVATGGLSKLQRVRRAVTAFKESGKPVIAAADLYTQPQYYLASAADEIYLHRMGMVLLTGYGSYRNYYKQGLDKLGVEANVFRVGEYKSAVEPYLRDDMSPEARESRREWLSKLWEAYKTDVAAQRDLSPEALQEYADGFHRGLAEQGGHAAELARAAGLVDEVVDRDRIRERMIELVGEDEEGETFEQIDYVSYAEAVGPPEREGQHKIAVVVARGPILDGSQPPGVIGGDSTARLLRQARDDDEVKALVLRVDSPGGSSFASEVIRREVELTRQAGIPVVASMSSVAASGGYWISMSADEIWANPTTITGSIGIYAMAPTFQKTLGKLGIHNDGVGTTGLAGALHPERDLTPEVAQAIQLMIEQGYRDFITRAADGRGKTPEEIDKVARGRVWIGETAQELGLVDRLGDLEAAIEAAAVRADVGDDYRVAYFEKAPDPSRQLLGRLLSKAGGWLGGGFDLRLPEAAFLERAAGLVHRGAADPLLADRRGILAYCFCEPW